MEADSKQLDFGSRGAHQVKHTLRGHYSLYYPARLIGATCQLKPIIWSNGTAMTPIAYHAFLKHLASWGYIVIASWSPMPVIDQGWFKSAIRKLQDLNDRDRLFKNTINLKCIGASGHSQGGGVALSFAKLDCVKATVAIQPAAINCQGSRHPLLIITSNRDIFVWPAWVFQYSFKTSPVLTYWLQHKKATHLMPLASGKDMRAPTTAFFQWHLSANEQARDYFASNAAVKEHGEKWMQSHKLEQRQ